jgi:adenylate kinase family enzyme
MFTDERILKEAAETQFCLACSKLTTYIGDAEEWHKNRCGIRSRENFCRIHIIGGPGSGKTTLAREIAGYLEIQAYELDAIAFTGPDFEERPIAERVAAIHEITTRPAWITEGLFVRWTDELLAQASIVVWLDHVNWQRGVWRITRRFIRSAVNEAKRRQGLERYTRFPDYVRHMKQLVQVFFSSRAYYAGRPSRSTARIESRQTTSEFLRPYKDKVVHCYSDEAVETFIEYIRFCHERCA